MREFATRDPHGFLAIYDSHVIIDEAIDQSLAGLQKWSALSGASTENLAVIYGGNTPLQTSEGAVLPLPAQFTF